MQQGQQKSSQAAQALLTLAIAAALIVGFAGWDATIGALLTAAAR